MLWLWILLGVIALILIIWVSTYNSLVSLRNKVKDQWSQIDVQLKKRADLIPNVVETVKGYAKHESETLENVIKARNSFVDATSVQGEIEASNQITQALGRLFALSESYPDLKANQSFLSLQADLREIENQISYARQFYNDSVLQLNNKVEQFPSNIIANVHKFTKETFFQVAEADRENVKVSFD